jgi:hypothetical protein
MAEFRKTAEQARQSAQDLQAEPFGEAPFRYGSLDNRVAVPPTLACCWRILWGLL